MNIIIAFKKHVDILTKDVIVVSIDISKWYNLQYSALPIGPRIGKRDERDTRENSTAADRSEGPYSHSQPSSLDY